MIGKFATSKAGHDKTECYVIVKEEGDFVYLCDGRLKPVQAPKKKNKKHIQLIGRAVQGELLEKLLHMGETGQGTVRDEEIRRELKNYKKSLQDRQK